jgi:large subunit ribosomal protein L6
MTRSVNPTSCRSRIGDKPIPLPSGVTCVVENNIAVITGPKGEQNIPWPPSLDVIIKDQALHVLPNRDGVSSIWGTMRSRVNSAIIGVHVGWSRLVNINGVGYKAQQNGRNIEFSLGKSHKDVHNLPDALDASISKDGTKLTLSGCSAEEIGNFAAKLKKLRRVNPYTASGISVSGDIIRRKEGKKKK